MTIRRQYSLPNCTLIIEGFSEDIGSANPNGRPALSTLVYAECRLNGSEQNLSGGRDFLENLVKAVSAYSQEFLSGFAHPQTQSSSEQVQIETVENKSLHRLTWHSDREEQPEKVAIDLTTVQLFDLVEAVDQFFADRQTLPELGLSLQPVSRKYRRSEESLAQRAAPAMIGTVSVALAAIAFFFAPIPEVRRPVRVIESLPIENIPNPGGESSVPGIEPTPLPEE